MDKDLPGPGEPDRVLVNPKRFMIATILYLRDPTAIGTPLEDARHAMERSG
ncbi:MAG: hypothetical protein F7B18_00820 [Desulfurococcales archaeon]|nr:hypothetical protein [Desulfurococcales archaeon]